MKKFKFISLILAVSIFCSVLCSCSANASLTFSIDDEGKFIYTVVRSGDNAAPDVEEAAKELRNRMKENFGCKTTIIKDISYEDFDGNLEILVGNTNREESNQALTMLKENRDNHADDFIIAVIGDKIVINAVKDETIPVAVEWFIKTFCQNEESWGLLKNNYKFIYAPEINDVPKTVAGKNLGSFNIVIPKGGSYMASLGAEEFVDYYSKNGYATKILYDIDPESEYEILLGNCNRKESESVTVEGDNYVIKVVDTKLIIKGGNDLATYTAFNHLLTEIKSENSFDWVDAHTINGKYDSSPKETYTLNWFDEFNGSAIDLNKWGDYRNQALDAPNSSCLGGVCYYSNVHGESTYYGEFTKIHQANGNLIMPAERLNDTDFISSAISTYWTMTFKYGILEIQGKLPYNPMTVSYWVNGASVDKIDFAKRFGTDQTRVCMLEVDILENYGRYNIFSSNIHRWWTEYDVNGKRINSAHKSINGNAMYNNIKNNMWYNYDKERFGDDINEEFHNYGFYWDENCMKFAFDGIVYCTYEFKDNQSSSVHCLMNYFICGTGLGNSSYGETYKKDIHKDYYEHQIDYIRIYQTASKNSQMITAWPQKQLSGTSTVFYPENTVGRQY